MNSGDNLCRDELRFVNEEGKPIILFRCHLYKGHEEAHYYEGLTIKKGLYFIYWEDEETIENE